MSKMKATDHAFYIDYVVLGQLIPALNCPRDIDTYVCEKNEVELFMPLYDTANGNFCGIRKWLAFIMVRGDDDKIFFSCGYDEDKSSVLFSSHKQALPSIFQGTSFKKHNSMLLNERSTEDFSKLFFYLPSTTDRKEKINRFSGNVQLHPVACRYEDFNKYSSKNAPFLPQDLDLHNPDKRLAAKEIVINFFKDLVDITNPNLVRNVNTLLVKGVAKITEQLC